MLYLKRMELEYRRDWDLFSMIALTLILVPVIYIFPDSVLRTVLGLPFLLFFPGYLAIAALFPRSDDLDSIERVALSFGLSIAITPLIGFGLNYTPWGIRLDPILFSISAFNIIVALVALQRRVSVLEPYVPFDPLRNLQRIWGDFQKERGLDKALSVILALSILSSVVALAYVIAFPREGESFTEFYVLGPDGKASGYPSDLYYTENATVILGLANHEHRAVNYTIVIWLVDMSFVDEETRVHELYYFDTVRPDEPLEHVPVDIEGPWTKQWEQEYTFSVDEPINNASWEGKIWFSLHKEGHQHEWSFMEDYSDDDAAVQEIMDGVKNERLSLNLNLEISKGTDFSLMTEDRGEVQPLDLTVTEEYPLVIGMTNHEFRPVEYNVLIWLVNTRTADNETEVNDLYYIDSLRDIELDHQDPNVHKGFENKTYQKELNYTVGFNQTFSDDPWEGKLLFSLHKDGAPDYDKGENYSANATALHEAEEAMAGNTTAAMIDLSIRTATEFAVLHDDLSGIEEPLNVTANEQFNLTAVLSNHELKTMNYTVVVWLLNTSAENRSQVETLYYLQNASVQLNHTAVNGSANLTAQHEMPLNITVNDQIDSHPWSGQLWFSLHKDDDPQDWDRSVEYSDDEDALAEIEEGMEGLRQHVSVAIEL